MGLSTLIQRAKFLLNDNSGTILTGLGVGGTAVTAYLSAHASFKAAELIRERELSEEDYDSVSNPILTPFAKTRLVWHLYIPAVGVGVTTITCIIVANKLSSKKIAALAVASGISERALQEYKAKVIEKLGDKQDTDLRDSIAQDRINNYPPNSREVILAGTGDVLCYDMLTGRYFQSTVEDIKRAENKINYELLHFNAASLSEFYDAIGLPPTTYTDQVGWGEADKFEVEFSTVLSTDNRPCIAISFKHPPQLEYARRYSAS